MPRKAATVTTREATERMTSRETSGRMAARVAECPATHAAATVVRDNPLPSLCSVKGRNVITRYTLSSSRKLCTLHTAVED